MQRQPRAQALVTAQHLDDTRREDLGGQLADLEESVRSKGRGLHDDGVASHDTRSDLAHSQEQGPVPGDNGAADAEGAVPDDRGPLSRVLDRLIWYPEPRGHAEVSNGELHLHVGRGEGLAGLVDQEVTNRIVVCLDRVGQLLHARAALVPGLGAPGRECRPGSCHGLVDLLLAGDGHLGEVFLRAWVHAMPSLCRRSELIVDHIFERLQSCVSSLVTWTALDGIEEFWIFISD